METEDATIPRPPPPPYYGTSEECDAPPRYFQHDPPSYDSLYVRVQSARDESLGFLDFFRKFLVLFAGTMGCSIAFAICFGVPVASIVIGSVYMFDCPAEHFIPIYLVVGGCVGLITTFITLVDRCQKRRIDDYHRQNDHRNEISPVNTLLSCFLIAWFLAGNIWVYRTYRTVTTVPGDMNYCHPVLYSFAFWMTTVTYMVFLLFCGCFCISSCIFGCLSNARSFLSNSPPFQQ